MLIKIARDGESEFRPSRSLPSYGILMWYSRRHGHMIAHMPALMPLSTGALPALLKVFNPGQTIVTRSRWKVL